MENKNRLLKILLFSVLIIASLVTYLSYGVKVKMTSTKLDFDNNPIIGNYVKSLEA